MTEVEAKRMKGKIIHLSEEGWGFVSSIEIPFTRIFFHWTSLNPKVNFKELHKGMEIEFTPKDFQDRGLRAIKIEVLNDTRTDKGTVDNTESHSD